MTMRPFQGKCHTCGHDHDAELQHWRDVLELATRADGMPASANERHLRRLLAVRVSMLPAYYDDGEAQGQEHGIVIDFMREPVADIDAKLRALNVARAQCRASASCAGCKGFGYVHVMREGTMIRVECLGCKTPNVAIKRLP
jgi:hypothetical protein